MLHIHIGQKYWLSTVLVTALWLPLGSGAATITVPDGAFNVGMRAQANVNYVDEDVGAIQSAWDTSARRIYLYLGGRVHPNFSYFAHLGADRLGQGMDTATGGALAASSENGLVTGLAVRDGWINWAPLPDALQVQVGRMLVPFLRNFGTHSGFANMNIDYATFQQTAMIPGRRVGRDDGIMLLGEINNGFLTYRVAMMDGAANDTNTTGGEQRLAGRVAVSLWEPEKGFWWQGTYLDTKRVLTIGVGFDMLDKATIAPGDIADHHGLGADVFLNLPMGGGALTAELNYARVEQTKVSGFGAAAVGSDVGFSGDYTLVLLGYLLPAKTPIGRIQPYLRYETFDYDSSRFGVANTVLLYKETGIGVNLYQKSHNTKVTLDYTKVNKLNDTVANPDFNRIGLQLQVSY